MLEMKHVERRILRGSLSIVSKVQGRCVAHDRGLALSPAATWLGGTVVWAAAHGRYLCTVFLVVLVVQGMKHSSSWPWSPFRAAPTPNTTIRHHPSLDSDCFQRPHLTPP
jgi:hypothetical protein